MEIEYTIYKRISKNIWKIFMFNTFISCTRYKSIELESIYQKYESN